MTQDFQDSQGQRTSFAVGLLRFRLLWVGLLNLLVAACTVGQVGTPPLIGGGNPPDQTTPHNRIDQTATPALPSSGLSDPAALSQPWGVYASPQVTPASTLIPAPVEMIPIPEGEINITLFGSDAGPGRMGYRTDAIILLTLNPNGKVGLTSFPRDLYVYIPGWRMQRLNAAQPWGGFTTSQETFTYNFGVLPDYYVTVNLSGFVELVDGLNGIDVNIGRYFYDARDGYPKGFILPAGMVHMDGQTALWYVRARETTSDIDRQRRQEEVLIAIGLELLSMDGLAHIPELYDIYQANVSTNITLDAALQLSPLLQKLDPQEVHCYTIGLNHVTQWIEPLSGAYYYVPKTDVIQDTLHEALNIP